MADDGRLLRLRVAVRGAVQGVGFRPFIYRLATGLGLTGWVKNSPQGVFIEVEGPRDALETFLLRIGPDKPPRASIQSLEPAFLDAAGHGAFEILPSDGGGGKTATILPDTAVCADCLREIVDPADRRYRYPFANCVNCGPRFSIVESLPYDRPNTAMKRFKMCAACQAEYDNPLDRRFHAQPNACPECGPHLELLDAMGAVLATRGRALQEAVEAVRGGAIAAVKGVGGFHLVADARNAAAVRELRRRKRREEKPLAVMFPSLDSARAECEISPLEERLLLSPESPIVLLKRKNRVRAETGVSPPVAPGNPYLGIMLPYSPLHHLLMKEWGFPVVATSGNLSDEPICTDGREALARLSGIADLFLTHDRPIVRPIDDSLVRVMAGRELVLRRARGYAPLPVVLAEPVPPAIAVGGHLKNSIAISAGRQVFLSQHVGDLETAQAYDAFVRTVEDFSALYGCREAGESPLVVARDAHPDYASTRFAEEMAKTAPGTGGVSVRAIQHHYAHILSCMAENEIAPPVLGVAWDGSGYGGDGSLWGGEFLSVTESGWRRFAHIRAFRLPGGEKAVKEPRRSALGLLYEVFGEAVFSTRDLPPARDFSPGDLQVLKTMLKKGVNSPVASSAGRLFDAVASLAGIRQRSGFEGQAAMDLEFALEETRTDAFYRFDLAEKEGAVVVDWEPMIREIAEDARRAAPAAEISAKFHNALAEIVVAAARRAEINRVALSGGCFQNKYLTERTVRRLSEEGFRPYWHQRVPPNDGGIALGQIAACRSRPGEP